MSDPMAEARGLAGGLWETSISVADGSNSPKIMVSRNGFARLLLLLGAKLSPEMERLLGAAGNTDLRADSRPPIEIEAEGG